MTDTGAELSRSLAETDAPVVRIERAARFGHPSLPTMQVNLAPMIDVVFLLLIYFLLTSQFRPAERAMALDVPSLGDQAAADPFALPTTPVTIRVRTVGEGPDDLTVVIDHPALAGGLATGADLEARLAEAHLASNQQFIVIALGSRWEHTVRVVSSIRAAGFDAVRLEAEDAPPGAIEP